MKVLVVIGTRPEMIKMAGIVDQLKKQGLSYAVLFTSQHQYNSTLSKFYVEHGSRCMVFDQPYSLGLYIDIIKHVIKESGSTDVIVQGDTSSVLAGALAGMYSDIRVHHVEAGLRSRKWKMLEEHNRIMVDSFADYLYAPTQEAYDNLENEEKLFSRESQMYLVGNTFVDAVNMFKPKKAKKAEQIMMTLHRKELTDDIDTLRGILKFFDGLMSKAGWKNQKLIFPVHPRTKDVMKREFGDYEKMYKRIEFIEPLQYEDNLEQLAKSKLIITDSGGLQEEASVLGVPCITMRAETERPETIEAGINTLFDPIDIHKISGRRNLEVLMADTYGDTFDSMELYGTNPSEKIVNIIKGIQE